MIIFGDKTVALFDLWSIEHFFTGCNSASIIGLFYHKFSAQKNEKTLFLLQWLTLLALELYWESVEFYFEAGYSHERITYWFQGVEYFANRLITDPLITVAGLFAVRAFPKIHWVAMPFSLVWLYFNIIYFDNCMEIQNRFFPYILGF